MSIFFTFGFVNKRRIYSICMLVLFGTFIGHSVFPHYHHAHADSETASAVGHHHHDGDEQHSHSDEHSSPENEQHPEGPLDFNFGHHSHNNYNVDYTTEVRRSIQTEVEGKKVVSSVVQPLQLATVIASEKLDAPPLYKNFSLENPFLLSCSLKSPPSIG